MNKSEFKKAITGEFGEAIQIDMENEVINLVMDVEQNAVVEEDGAIRWTKSGRYVQDGYCEMLEYAKYGFNRIATAKKRMQQIVDEIESLFDGKLEYSDEKLSNAIKDLDKIDIAI